MTILILGGTGFLGPHIVEAALARKHTVTLFNRGKTNPKLFPDLEKLTGDRKSDLKALEGRKWDAVVDTSGYFPRELTMSAGLLKDAVKQYVFISTISVYPDFKELGKDESAPVGKIADEKTEKVTGETYGPLKALCEQEAERLMPGRVTNIRPGLIVGPGDPTDRFTYWPERIDRGGEVLAPAPMSLGVQYIDARDLAEWCITVLEDGHVGVYNAVGPKYPETFEGLVYGCKAVTTSDAHFTWVDSAFLLEKGVGPWMELPLWVPSDGDEKGFASVSSKKAIDHGLKFRPLADTARDTLAWLKTLPKDRKRGGAGLAAEKEAAVLKAWHEKQSPTTRP